MALTPLHPFPTALMGQAAALVSSVMAQGMVSPDAFRVDVDGETITIPERIYVDEATFRASGEGLEPLADCLLTRHHDGFVRARAVSRILDLNKCWSMPYLVRLTGEYVVEILDLIDESIDRIDPAVAGGFVRDNPSFFATTRRRVASYWDCYYRPLGAFDDYVGNRLIRGFEGMAARDQDAPPNRRR